MINKFGQSRAHKSAFHDAVMVSHHLSTYQAPI